MSRPYLRSLSYAVAIALMAQVSIAAPSQTSALAPIAPVSNAAAATDQLALVKNATVRADQFLKSIKYTEYSNALKKAASVPTKEGQAVQKLLGMFEKKQYTFAMDRSHDIRLKVLQSGGFLNQHESGTSSAAFAPEKRAKIESSFLGLTLNDYNAIPNQEKPKSTYLFPLVESGIEPQPTHYISRKAKLVAAGSSSDDWSKEVYAGDTWLFDLEKIQSNTLFVVGDSLDRPGFGGEFYDGRDFSLNPDATMNPEELVSYPLPLNNLNTAVPFFLNEVLQVNIFRTVDDTSLKAPYYEKLSAKMEEMNQSAASEPGGSEMTAAEKTYYQNFLNTRMPEVTFTPQLLKQVPELEKFKEKYYSFAPYGRYVEGLVYGKLSLAMVKYFIYRDREPDSEERKLLAQYKITICYQTLKACEKPSH